MTFFRDFATNDTNIIYSSINSDGTKNIYVKMFAASGYRQVKVLNDSYCGKAYY